MKKREVMELKKRLSKNGCTFTKMSGCYVNAHKEIQLMFNETFLNLEEEEFYKYLEIAKKALSGTVGNNLIHLPIAPEEEQAGGRQQFLLGLRESKLKNEGLLETFYSQIIEHYTYVGNYLILIFHDAYDVMTKTSDNNKLDESEEVYEYLLCAICPVDLTKPGLGYLETENRIGARNRDWVVQAPDTGFLFPAFTDRSSDIHSVLFYTKNTEQPHKEIAESILGCMMRPTATEKKKTFEKVVTSAIEDEDQSKLVFGEIQESLNLMLEEQMVEDEIAEVELLLTKETVSELLAETSLPPEIAVKIEEKFEEEFKEEPPVVDQVLDKKILAEYEKNKTTRVLAQKVNELQEKLQKTENADYDIFLRVKPGKADQIDSRVIDGKKYVMIPVDENETVTINGTIELE